MSGIPLVGAAIITHPHRLVLADNLRKQINTHRPIRYIDIDGIGCTANHLAAWSDLQYSDSEWSMVLEDDAILHPEFDVQLPMILDQAPAPVVSLYLGRGRPAHWQRKIERAVAASRPFIVSTVVLHAVALVIRTDWLPTIIEAATEAANSPAKKLIDEALTEAVKLNAIPVAYSLPSIVNHDDTLPSVAEHPHWNEPVREPRVAWQFGARSERAPWSPVFAIM